MPLRSGTANLPLHGGHVPPWLSSRMARLGRVITEAIVHEYGREEFLSRLAHPFWFQSFGAVMGMDWHSSGITTSVVGALKRGLAPVQDELGLYVCGGKGAHSRRTPGELEAVGDRCGVDATALARSSRLVAKIDSAAVQDGFDLYLHAFFATRDGQWCVVQQGMNGDLRQARRYHWHSEGVRGFFESPHAAIEGRNVGAIVNLADVRAARNRDASLEIARGGPATAVRVLRRFQDRSGTALELFPEIETAEVVVAATPARTTAANAQPLQAQPHLQPPHLQPPHLQPPHLQPPHLQLPHRHHVRASDVMLKRLHGTLAAVANRGPIDFAELLLTPNVGERTIAALAFVAEVIHGAPSRFSDPARYSLALGGKDGAPFPVPLAVFDRTIRTLKSAVARAKLGKEETLAAIRRLDVQARLLERHASGPSFDAHVASEWARSPALGGRTI